MFQPPGSRSAGRGAARDIQFFVVHAQVGVAGRKAQHEHHAAGVAVQGDDVVWRHAGRARHVGQVGAVLAAVADGDVDLAAVQGVGRDAVGQQGADAGRQAATGGAVAQPVGPVMHRHRDERGHHIGDAGQSRGAQFARRGQTGPADRGVDPVTEGNDQAAVALRQDAPRGFGRRRGF
ncbi:hypothetical protein G6F22_019324 [Rhizopus arrhizus]|nr:hypothetical protein G6F22_019324 [Rhizopus arrhizus]